MMSSSPSCRFATARRALGAARLAAIAPVWLLGVAIGSAAAQVAPDAPTLSRSAIEQRIASLDSAVARERNDAARYRLQEAAHALRERLRIGDFLPGDRLLVSVTRGAAPRDTVVVGADTTIAITGLPEVSLQGVLRAELVPHVHAHLARFVREPAFAAVPLVRIGVFGGVRTGGYYEVPADSRLSDLLMRAGGPVEGADPQRTVLRRGNRELMDRDAVSYAIRTGQSLDQLGIQSGDELTIAMRRQMQWGQLLQWTTAIAGLITVIGISR